jgi:hypothetical protein
MGSTLQLKLLIQCPAWGLQMALVQGQQNIALTWIQTN